MPIVIGEDGGEVAVFICKNELLHAVVARIVVLNDDARGAVHIFTDVEL